MKGRKTGGRVAGTPNKISFSLRSKMQGFLEDKFEDMVEAWGNLSGKEKVDAFDKMLRYIVPPARDMEPEDEAKDSTSALIDRLFNRGKETSE